MTSLADVRAVSLLFSRRDQCYVLPSAEKEYLIALFTRSVPQSFPDGKKNFLHITRHFLHTRRVITRNQLESVLRFFQELSRQKYPLEAIHDIYRDIENALSKHLSAQDFKTQNVPSTVARIAAKAQREFQSHYHRDKEKPWEAARHALCFYLAPSLCNLWIRHVQAQRPEEDVLCLAHRSFSVFITLL